MFSTVLLPVRDCLLFFVMAAMTAVNLEVNSDWVGWLTLDIRSWCEMAESCYLSKNLRSQACCFRCVFAERIAIWFLSYNLLFAKKSLRQFGVILHLFTPRLLSFWHRCQDLSWLTYLWHYPSKNSVYSTSKSRWLIHASSLSIRPYTVTWLHFCATILDLLFL